ncbi:hypothetical protein ACIOWI_36990 [Streptomyces sp. NPDC087659]|uniref:hypothetical protein n=1 Tax=Streptomyces sp. NPDC087659 TaxID=3365801 RepID=UPI00380FF74F
MPNSLTAAETRELYQLANFLDCSAKKFDQHYSDTVLRTKLDDKTFGAGPAAPEAVDHYSQKREDLLLQSERIHRGLLGLRDALMKTGASYGSAQGDALAAIQMRP